MSIDHPLSTNPSPSSAPSSALELDVKIEVSIFGADGPLTLRGSNAKGYKLIEGSSALLERFRSPRRKRIRVQFERVPALGLDALVCVIGDGGACRTQHNVGPVLMVRSGSGLEPNAPLRTFSR